MLVVRSIAHAFRRSASLTRMILLLYAANLLFTVPLALLFRSTVLSDFAGSLSLERFMEGFDFTVLNDFLNVHGPDVSVLMRSAFSFLIPYMILNTFLAGGILAYMGEGLSVFSFEEFFGKCGEFFGRFFRLFVMFGLVLVVVGIVFGGVAGILYALCIEHATSDRAMYWAIGGSLLLAGAPIMLVLMIADYAKVTVAMNDSRDITRAVWQATRFVFRRLLSTAGLQLSLLLVSTAIVFVSFMLEISPGPTNPWGILMMFLVEQLLVILRVWTRVLFFSGEAALWGSLQPAPWAWRGDPSQTPPF